MKKSFLSAAIFTLATLGAGSAFAESPLNFPADNFQSTKTRAQVQAELAEAIRTGDIIVDGQMGLTAYQLNPSAFPERAMATGKTRAEVLSELEKARMDGSLARLSAETQRG
jgi:hypothetical protein